MHGIAPTNLSSSNDITITTLEPAATPTSDAALTGNLGTWLTDWTKNLTEQPPPASLDHWLQGLVSQNMHEPIGKTTSPKGRLNTYLNAAQEVLSQHGYNVSNEITPTTNIEQTKGGMFGNVKQMYFLVCFVFSFSFSSIFTDLYFDFMFSGKHWIKIMIEK